MEFKDEIETAKREIDELKAEGADAIVAIAHIGEYTNVSCDSEKLAQAMTGDYAGALDVIIDGHSHTVEEKTVNDVVIVQTGTGLANLGKVTLDFGDDTVLDQVQSELLSYEQVMELAEPSQEVTAALDQVNEKLKERLSEVVGENTAPLWGGTINGMPEARMTETNLGSFAADAYRQAAIEFLEQAEGMEAYAGLPVVGAENGGGIRASLPAGTVTKGDFVSVFPFANTLMMKEVTPKLLFQVLEKSISGISGQNPETGLLEGELSGGFLQVSGIRFSYDPSAAAGEKIQEIRWEDTDEVLNPEDTETRIILVTNNFIMNGGSDHSELAELPLVGEIGGELETVEAYFVQQAGGSSLPYYGAQNRIVVSGAYTPGEYAATILIQNEDGTPAANEELEVWVDNDAPVVQKTDEAGTLVLTVSDGAHTVRIAQDGAAAYINNYTGAGTMELEGRPFPALTRSAEVLPEETQAEQTTEAQTEAEQAAAPAEEKKSGIPAWTAAVVVIAVLAVGAVVVRKKRKINGL